MKIKILALGLACLFMSLFLSSQKVDFAKFTPEEAAKYFEKRFQSLDYDFKVEVDKDKKSGKINFLFNLKKAVKDMRDVEEFAWEIASMVADITSITSWSSDKAIVYFKGKPFFWIYTKDCRAAQKIIYGRMEFIVAHLHYFKKN